MSSPSVHHQAAHHGADAFAAPDVPEDEGRVGTLPCIGVLELHDPSGHSLVLAVSYRILQLGSAGRNGAQAHHRKGERDRPHLGVRIRAHRFAPGRGSRS